MTETNIANELKRLSRRIEEIAKTQDLLFHDREILEDILSRLSAVESAIQLQRTTQTENAKNTKADINEVKEAVKTSVEEVAATIDDKTLIVKSPKQSVIEKILNKVGR